MTNHRYQLQPYTGTKSRFICPKCQHRTKTFKRYIDTETGKTLAEHVGRCDREENCGYHYTPKEYFKANSLNGSKPFTTPFVKRKPMPPHDTIPRHFVDDSMRSTRDNNFLFFLGEMLGYDTAKQLATKYHVGTASHWPGATVFWQVDTKGKVRTGKVMLYYTHNCKRVKEPFNHITWVHKLLYSGLMRNAEGGVRNELQNKNSAIGIPTSDFQLKQCLFGEHLLAAEPGKTVAIVESEKTAIIASHYMPEYIWLAAGSLDGLNVDKCKVLKGRNVMLYPDVNGYAKWHNKARELNLRMPTTTFTVDDTMLNAMTPYDIANGSDIADMYIDEYLLQLELMKDWGLG